MGEHKKLGAHISKFGDTFASTRAEIHLDRLASNIRNVMAYVGPRVQLMAVVKADGYGHGSIAVGRGALAAGAQHLAVYTFAEAMYLRKACIEGSLVVLGPMADSMAEACVTHDITPCITTIELAIALSAAAVSAGKTVSYHVELDTGLTRLGIFPEEALPFTQALDALPGLRREGLFTHFAGADEASKESVFEQFHVFLKIKHMLAKHDITFPLAHVAASSATVEFPEMHLDLVRCGLCLYGYYPSPYVKHTVDVEPVMALGSHLARVRAVHKGVGVSYGHDWKATHKSVIGLVPFGYADGMPRTVQGKGYVLVRGHKAPIVGRVAMDQFMVDLTKVKGACEGDLVT
ncbi:MAG TPA: alanine racemase, partial [Chloroflexota bacterium]|nr:alanine racemase [Chloroflexota bacterium]